jgi:HTH-type transcriptional regulator / antitoxin HigA
MTDKNDSGFGKREDDFDVDRLLRDLYKPPVFDNKESLNELFERRIQELNVSRTNALDILKIERLTLNGILGGTQKRVDFTNLIKIANFLQIPKEQVIKLYVEVLEINFPEKKAISPDKIAFINENFDLAGLKKAKFLDSITDYEEIENRVIHFFGLKSIFDYKKPPVDVAFSAGLVKPKNEYLRSFWIKAAITLTSSF